MLTGSSATSPLSATPGRRYKTAIAVPSCVRPADAFAGGAVSMGWPLEGVKDRSSVKIRGRGFRSLDIRRPSLASVHGLAVPDARGGASGPAWIFPHGAGAT